ncbi:MAG TPA: SDR family oxidoreductase [Kofleriaceae bacterium]|jgi:NAD(P)-dependent dehydrogenase (short-subunit alcohol dehydrogenase family)
MKRVVVITGGTAGVGRATTCRFARSGDSVAVLARGRDGLDATLADIEQLGARGLAIQTDVADAAQVEAAAERVERELGPIDVWINNAMTTVVGDVASISPAEFERVTAVCYLGFVWGTRAALARMRPRNRGTIIQVGSALAYRSIPLQAPYCAAKHAIHGFTDSLRSELLHDGVAIELCMVQLPAVNTPQFGWCENKMDHAVQPVPPIFQPEIIAEALYDVSLRPRREVFLGWPSIKAIVGNKLAPGYADRYLASDGYSGQLLPGPPLGGPSNLFEPVAGDAGAHGAFDERARDRDAVARVSTRLGAAGVQAAIAVGALAAAGALMLGVRAIIRR